MQIQHDPADRGPGGQLGLVDIRTSVAPGRRGRAGRPRRDGRGRRPAGRRGSRQRLPLAVAGRPRERPLVEHARSGRRPIRPIVPASDRASTRAASTKVGSLSSVRACWGVLATVRAAVHSSRGGVEVGQHRVEEGPLPVHVDAAAVLAVVRYRRCSRDRGTGGSRSSRAADRGRRSGRRCRG